MSVHHSETLMTAVAVEKAKEHRCNYNIIIHNPVDGWFKLGHSTFEMVADSYFNKERPNVMLVKKTDDILTERARPVSDTLEILEALEYFQDWEADQKRLMYKGLKCTEDQYKDANELTKLPG